MFTSNKRIHFILIEQKDEKKFELTIFFKVIIREDSHSKDSKNKCNKINNKNL